MTILEIINNVLAGGLLGALGQGIRIAVGFKKMNDSNTIQLAQQGNTLESFSASRLLISLFIGFVAGAIAMLVKGPSMTNKPNDYNTEFIVTIMAIGYSGADFIEGVFNTYINKFSPTSTGGENSAGQVNQLPESNNKNAQQLDSIIAG
jgi:hypothetical protein